MHVGASTVRTSHDSKKRANIVVVDDNERFLSVCRRWLAASGFDNVQCFKDGRVLLEDRDRLSQIDLLLLDIHLEQNCDGLELLKQLRQNGYGGLAVIISGDSSKEQCFRAVRAGANDFLLKRPCVDVAAEISRLIERGQYQAPGEKLAQAALSDLGYLRSFGLTEKEIALLEEYAVDYCSHQELAMRVDKAEGHVRKMFSRIYKKLQIDNLSQLVYVLTNCTLFSARS